jgi:hypothetical protein
VREKVSADSSYLLNGWGKGPEKYLTKRASRGDLLLVWKRGSYRPLACISVSIPGIVAFNFLTAEFK